VTLRYKFVELSPVTEDSLEHAVNHWVAQGWQLDSIRFVVTEHSKRPAMAFVSFTCSAEVARVESLPHVIAADDNDVE
jgi:hypothetical protein